MRFPQPLPSAWRSTPRTEPARRHRPCSASRSPQGAKVCKGPCEGRAVATSRGRDGALHPRSPARTVGLNGCRCNLVAAEDPSAIHRRRSPGHRPGRRSRLPRRRRGWRRRTTGRWVRLQTPTRCHAALPRNGISPWTLQSIRLQVNLICAEQVRRDRASCGAKPTTDQGSIAVRSGSPVPLPTRPCRVTTGLTETHGLTHRHPEPAGN